MSVKTHELKTWPVVFQAIVDGSKTFEFRRNDRDFKSGDEVTLAEWNPTEKEYTGRTETFTVGHVAKGAWGIPDGYCVFSLIPPTLRTRLQQVESERDQYKHEAEMWDEHMGPLTDYEGDEAPWQTMVREFENLRDQRDRAEADAAVMRQVVEKWQEIGPDEESQQYVDAALATNAGKSLLERLKVAEQALDKLARLGNEPQFGNSKGNVIAQEALTFLNPKPQDVK